jgi:solute carrier family 35 protein
MPPTKNDHSKLEYQQLIHDDEHDNNANDSTYVDVSRDYNLNKAPHFTEKSRKSNSSKTVGGALIRSLYHESFMKLFSAIFYASTSFLIIVINKIILTNYSFPSANVLGVGQMFATIVVLFGAKKINIITFPFLTRDTPSKIFPLPLLYIGNLVFGLSSTQKLSLPMFTVLRRFAILLTMVLEYTMLSVHQTNTVVASVFGMIGGAIIAALDDLAFDARGYFFVLSNDVCTALNGVYLKKKLNNSRELGKYGLMYYNSLFMIVPLLILVYFSGDIDKVKQFEYYSDAGFLFSFLSSCFMGFLLMWSTVLCTSYNSALTTTIIGCLKNILITYIGMYIGGDYVFSVTNFIGVNISMIASLVYSYVTFVQSKPASTIENHVQSNPVIKT